METGDMRKLNATKTEFVALRTAPEKVCARATFYEEVFHGRRIYTVRVAFLEEPRSTMDLPLIMFAKAFVIVEEE